MIGLNLNLRNYSSEINLSATTTNFSWSRIDAGNHYWFSIGYQQWGFIVPTGSATTWVYPTRFSKYVAIVTARYYTGADEESTWEMAIKSYSLFQCAIIRGRDTTNGIFVIAIGVQQWGVGVTPIQFPIAFPVACLWVQPVYNVNAAESNSAWYACYANNISATGFTNGYNESLSTRWYAIGKQQWGTLDNSSNAREWTKTFTYPLAMSTLLSAITTVKHNTHEWAFTSVCHNVTNTSCLCGYYGIGSSAYCRYATVVIVGKQQWRFNATSPVQIYEFPISFSSTPYVCVTGNTMRIDSTDTDGWENVIGVTNITSTGFRVTTPASVKHSVEVIALGKQQWGLYDNGTVVPGIAGDVKYHISFTTAFSTMTYAYRGDGGTIPSLSIIVQFDNTGFHYEGWRPNSLPGARYVTWMALGIQQWGYNLGTTSTTDTFTFPIAFPTACHTIITSVKWDTNDGYSARPVTAFTKTNFTMYVKRSDFYICWISFGKQQWGTIGNTDNYKPYTFSYPLKLNVFCTVLVARECTDATEKSVSIQSKTLNDVVIYGYHSTNIAIFVIGKQQWGYTTSINGDDEVVFPIAFSNSSYSITGSTYDSLLIYCPKFTSKSTTKCIMHNGIGHVSYNGNSYLDWFAIGVQQWGVRTSNLPKDSDVAITYPVAFTTFASGVSQSIGVSSAWNFVQNDCSLTAITVVSQGAVRSKCWWIAIGK